MENSLLFKLFSLLPENPSNDEIENSYKALCKIYHPDKNPERSEWANEMMKQLNEAREFLLDPSRRAFYIKELKDKRARERNQNETINKVKGENAVLKNDLQRNKEATGMVAVLFLLLGAALFSGK